MIPCARRMYGGLSQVRLRLGVAVTVGLVLISSGCVTQSATRSTLAPAGQTIRAWTFAMPDGTPYSSDNAMGRPTVVLFLTTYDTASQIAATRLDLEIHELKRRVNAVGVAMEPPNHAVLVGVFHDSLHLSFPLLMPDPATLAGDGPFGVVDVVPTWVILDGTGRQIWRGSGVSAIDELRGILGRLGAAAEG
jgi:hypothetical protein